jgi:hypothetical protein
MQEGGNITPTAREKSGMQMGCSAVLQLEMRRDSGMLATKARKTKTQMLFAQQKQK